MATEESSSPTDVLSPPLHMEKEDLVKHSCTVQIRTLTGMCILQAVDLDESVSSLKYKICEKLGLDDSEAVQLSFRSKVLEKGSLGSYGIIDGSELYLTLRLNSGLVSNERCNRLSYPLLPPIKKPHIFGGNAIIYFRF